MLQHLPESIQSFSTQSRKTVSSLIQSIKADKAQVSALVENIRSFEGTANYSPTLALRYSLLNVEGVLEFFRDSSLRVGQFFSASSSISNVLNSIATIYVSEIEKIEKDIYHLENFINNYQFIVGEDDLFNFNYVENFDNNLNSYEADGSRITLFDRDGINFNDNGNYYVDSVLSKLSVSSGINFINQSKNWNNIREYNNYSKYITTETGFESVLDEDLFNNWNVTIKSPLPISSELTEVKKYVDYDTSYVNGAQTLVEVWFINDSEIDTIRITPNDSAGLQLLQVIIEKTDPTDSSLGTGAGQKYTEFPILNSPLVLEKTVDVVFDKCKVSKIKFIFNQSKYIRTENTPIAQELNSKLLHEIVRKRRQQKRNAPSKLQDLVYFYFKNANDIAKNRNNPKAYTEVYSYRYPLLEENYTDGVNEKILQLNEDQVDKKSIDYIESKNSSPIENMVQTLVQYVIGSRNNLFNTMAYRTNRTNQETNRLYNLRSDGFVPVKDELNNFDNSFQKLDASAPGVSLSDISKYISTRETTNSYEYTFSLKNISFGLTSQVQQNKSCFVSKKIETDGAPLGVKAIVNKVNARRNLLSSNYELREPGSYELSVCYSDVISSELDWIPVYAGSNDYVESEVLFFDSNNFAKLRFIPKESTIKLYKNGLLENPNSWTYSELRKGIVYSTSTDPLSAYVVEYYLNTFDYKQDLVDLDSLKNSQFAVRAFANGGIPGEKFMSTSPGNKLNLSYIPYVENKFANATYSTTYGTINTTENIGYSPVNVVLADKQVAINLTNYTSNSFVKASFYDTTNYLFFQSGKELIFNKPITQPITVNYSYIPSSLRFRLILRNNIPKQYNGISIDNVIIKCKTKNLDPFSEKLLRL